MCIYYFINFCSHQLFSLFSVHNDLSSSSSFSQMHTNTPTHKRIHTNKSTHKQTNREIDRCLWSLVRGLADEEVIWVVELGSWIGWWRSDLGYGAWFVDRPMKKGSGSAGEERTRWRKDLVNNEKERERLGSFWERERGDLFRKNE